LRVCQKHFKKAVEVLKSLKTGEEFDLCEECSNELREIVYGKPEADTDKRVDRVRRPAGRPKTKMA
jgi:hypothetical protein